MHSRRDVLLLKSCRFAVAIAPGQLVSQIVLNFEGLLASTVCVGVGEVGLLVTVEVVQFADRQATRV